MKYGHWILFAVLLCLWLFVFIRFYKREHSVKGIGSSVLSLTRVAMFTAMIMALS